MHAIWSIFIARRYTNAVHAVVVYLSVRLCVCVSVTLRYCVKTAKRRITQMMPYDILVADFLLTSALRGPSTIAELLVIIYWYSSHHYKTAEVKICGKFYAQNLAFTYYITTVHSLA